MNWEVANNWSTEGRSPKNPPRAINGVEWWRRKITKRWKTLAAEAS